ncbi:MAG: 6,7-dimethyl-8-ribityllumazine synthase [Nitriliruptoraceae bacterium]
MTDITHLEGSLDASGLTVAVVAGRFNEVIVRALVEGATSALLRHGASSDAITVVWTPGSWELPVVLDRLAASGRYDALVALGCVVRGETAHFDYVAGEGSNGTAAVARTHGIPIGNGVLTTETWDQAVARAGGKLGNKGAEAALAAVETATLLRNL